MRAAANVDRSAMRKEIIEGLTAASPRVSPKFLYDPLGSRLFEAITALPEYYPTRTEKAILAECIGQIVPLTGTGCTFIELGAGNCEKAHPLFSVLRPAQYVAIDLSVEFLERALGRLRSLYPDLDILGLGMDFSRALRLPATVRRGKRLFFYPGSSIGNFTPEEALGLLSTIRKQCARDGHLLIGVDLVKDIGALVSAYDDPLGVTAAFNVNILNHLNALIGSDFNLGDWQHRALFNENESRIEMHLEARRDAVVSWRDGGRHFPAGARIHTENSYKYELAHFNRLLVQAGFGAIRSWTDDKAWFGMFLASSRVHMAMR